MQILSVIQRMATVVGMTVPEAVFASDQRSEQEFGALANQMAESIASEHDWQRLRRKATITGDGTSDNFALPYDYSRMPDGTMLRTAEGPMEHVIDHDEWLDWQLRSLTPCAFGAWTMIGDRIEIRYGNGVLPAGLVVKYWYQSDRIVRTDGTAANSGFPFTLPFELADSDEYGYAATGFVSDSDHFQLSWQLLELRMIWQWRANKGLPYAEDMASYEAEKARVVKRERSPSLLRVGGPRVPYGLRVAYPGVLGG